MARKKSHRVKVIEPFKKRNKSGTIKNYDVGDTFVTSHIESIEYLRLIKKIK